MSSSIAPVLLGSYPDMKGSSALIVFPGGFNSYKIVLLNFTATTANSIPIAKLWSDQLEGKEGKAGAIGPYEGCTSGVDSGRSGGSAYGAGVVSGTSTFASNQAFLWGLSLPGPTGGMGVYGEIGVYGQANMETGKKGEGVSYAAGNACMISSELYAASAYSGDACMANCRASSRTSVSAPVTGIVLQFAKYQAAAKDYFPNAALDAIVQRGLIELWGYQ